MKKGTAKLSLGLAHQSNRTLALECGGCERRSLCGGLSTRDAVFGCGDFCRCKDKSRCPIVCPNKPYEFVRRFAEVGGFELDIPVAPSCPLPDLPRVVPIVYDPSRFAGPIPAAAVAIPLARLFSQGIGVAFSPDREHLLSRYRLAAATQLVISGVGKEQPIENYWRHARCAGFIDSLAAYRPALLTVPNFSLYSDVPREDNLYNMKRIAICWREIADRGIPAALHPNARTDRDSERWGDFLRAHPEITALSYEFGTGAKLKPRSAWHVSHLLRLANRVGRPMTLVVRGGQSHLSELATSFIRVIFLTATPTIATRNARSITWDSAQRKFRSEVASVRRGQRLDRLFRQNLDAVTQRISEVVAPP